MGEPELVPTDQKLPPKSLAERLEAEMNGNAAAEPSPSRMARRFAPDLATPRPREIKLDLSTIEPWRTAKPRDRKPGGPGAPGAWPNAILLAALILVALVPTVTVGMLMWQGLIPAPWLHSTKAEPIAPAPAIAAPATQASAAAKQDTESPTIALTAPTDLKAEAGKSVPFAISLDSTDTLPARSIITISGLPSGATFTDGRPYGDTDWSLRPDEIGDLQLTLPAGASGERDLDVALISADGTELASAATRLSIAADPKAALVSRPQDVGLVSDLIAHGRKMIEVGYLAGARAYYQRAAEAGSGEAAFALAATYDPALITEIGAQGIKPDVSQARIWYARALALGETRAEAELSRLNGSEVPAVTSPSSDGPSQSAAPVTMQGELSATVQPVAVSSDQAASATAAAAPAPAAAADGSAAAEPQWIELSGAANMRENPSGSAAAIKVVQRGTKLREVARQHGWVQVIDPATSQTGWIYSRFVAQASAGQ